MSRQLYCLAQFLPKAGKEKEVFRLLQALEPNTLREDGCISYRVTVRRQLLCPIPRQLSCPVGVKK